MSYLLIGGIALGALITYTILESNYNSNNNLNIFIKKIIRQAARWSTASQQDTNPLIRVLHANYGAAYMFALSDAGITPDEIESIIGNNFNYKETYDLIIQIQDDASRNAIKVCKDFGPAESILTKIAGE